MAAVEACGAGRGARSVHRDAPRSCHLVLLFPGERLAGVADRLVEARAMRPIRLTPTHQNITFSRRMLLPGAAQGAVGALLIGRMGWLSVAQNQKYQLLSKSNRVQLIPVPPRRGWIVDRYGKPIAINQASFRVDIIPQQMEKNRDIVPE